MLYILRDGEFVVCRSEEFINEDKFREVLINLINSYPEILIPRSMSDEKPRFLFLIKEFPTSTGSIDLFGVDNGYSVYVIETKLYRNRERRKAISQALDYAASIWSRNKEEAEEIINNIEYKLGKKLDEETRKGIIDSLVNGYFKIIIAFDRIDDTLKKIIDFLNETCEFDIYAVELRKIVGEDGTIIISYKMYPDTEPQPHRPSRKKRIWNEQLFFIEVKQKLSSEQVDAIRRLYEFSKNLFGESNIYWGVGGKRGTFKVRLPKVFGDKDIYNVDTCGCVSIAFANIYGISNELDEIVDMFAEKLYVNKFLNVQVNHDNYREEGKKYPTIKLERWVDKVDKLIEIIKEFHDGIKYLND